MVSRSGATGCRHWVLVSLTEGEDKPLKYPVMFERADLVVITKLVLAPHPSGSQQTPIGFGQESGSSPPRRRGDGLDEVVTYLEGLCSSLAGVRPLGQTIRLHARP
ncbi:MAG: hypothetical protein JNL21_16760 [Myxococcales bacterium]|nr:hypothetical protein [Myxococcales bacterium]